MTQPILSALRISVASQLDQVTLIGRAVRALCAEVLTPDDIDAVEISLAEAMNNVILHGYKGRPGNEIELSVEIGRSEVRLTISDTAAPMPEGLLEAAGEHRFQFDKDDLAEVPEGGMGLALIRMSMDEVDYRTADGRNWLRMLKRSSAAG